MVSYMIISIYKNRVDRLANVGSKVSLVNICHAITFKETLTRSIFGYKLQPLEATPCIQSSICNNWEDC